MQEQTKIEETVDSIKEYLNTRYELAVLKGADTMAHLVSNVLSAIPLIFLSVLTVLMLSFALALYLNTVYNSMYCGFVIVGVSYFVILLCLFAVRKDSIAKPLRNLIIKELFKNHNL
jgi:hypothetical protein